MHGSATITTTPDPMARSGYVEAVIATYLWVPAQPSPPSCSGQPDVSSILPTLNRSPSPRTPLLHDRPRAASRTPSRARLRRPPTPQTHATRQGGLPVSIPTRLRGRRVAKVLAASLMAASPTLRLAGG